jgi:hypothetical protein
MINEIVNLGKNVNEYYYICLWCTNEFGITARFTDCIDNDHKWMTDTFFGEKIFYFANKEDALLFKLRWINND